MMRSGDAMPGGATSSSQEGAMKQGYIRLLPYMLKFLEGTRQIIRYHDVTPGLPDHLEYGVSGRDQRLQTGAVKMKCGTFCGCSTRW